MEGELEKAFDASTMLKNTAAWLHQQAQYFEKGFQQLQNYSKRLRKKSPIYP